MKLWTLQHWPDQTENGRYTTPRGWWFRFGQNGLGLSYKNLSKAGYNPLFSERYGHDRTLAVRFGPYLFKILKPFRFKRVPAEELYEASSDG